MEEQKHFVLVHGACHGAWTWYRLKPLLEKAGHRVTTLDLTASGINMKAIQDVVTFREYTQPLLKFLSSLQPNARVVLVGHSLGGLNLALAMELFPDKIAAAVFLTAFMPDTVHKPSFVLEQYSERTNADNWLDTQFAPYTPSQPHLISMFFGPKFLSSKLYQLSPIEDLELAKTLARPSSLFVHDLSHSNNFSDKGYGSVARVYVLCDADKAITNKFQRWMIENSPVQEVVVMNGADHMAMFSKPRELCHNLIEIANKYA